MRISDWSSDVCASDLLGDSDRFARLQLLQARYDDSITSLQPAAHNPVASLQLAQFYFARLCDIFLPYHHDRAALRSHRHRSLRHEETAGFHARVNLRANELEIGRAHVCTPVTNAHLVCRLLLEKKQIHQKHSRPINTTMNELRDSTH